MKNKSLKSVLKFWQEIVLAVPIGLLLIEITKNRMLRLTMDGADIFMVLWFLPLLVCLVGQFFWKKEAVAETLSVFLGVSAVIVILMALWGISNSPSYRTESIAMLVIGVVSVIAVITMPRKYNPNINAGTLVKQ
jgi:FtsH-binding integral membrane protein